MHLVHARRVALIADAAHPSSINAVTMPNMPCSDSASGSLWQCNAQTPRLSQLTINAVTMPNMPCSDSACGSIWQWNAQTPGLSQLTMTSHLSPGATLSVSHFHGAG